MNTYIFKDLWMVLLIAGVMTITYFLKYYEVFTPLYAFLDKRIRSKKILVVLLSMIGGILPVPGRVIISAGLLDTVAARGKKSRAKFGVIDYLATHHYYLWSPLEKTVLIPMAALHLNYIEVLAYTWPLILISIIYLLFYIQSLDFADIDFKKKSEKDMLIRTSIDWRQVVRWDVCLFVALLILARNFICGSGILTDGYIKNFIGQPALIHNNWQFVLISIIGFGTSLMLGSSSKFIGIATILTSVYGLEFFTYFFAIEFIGYLLSPMHKCVFIGMKYFGTSLYQYYSAILLWCLALLIVGISTIW